MFELSLILSLNKAKTVLKQWYLNGICVLRGWQRRGVFMEWRFVYGMENL